MRTAANTSSMSITKFVESINENEFRLSICMKYLTFAKDFVVDSTFPQSNERRPTLIIRLRLKRQLRYVMSIEIEHNFH